MASKELINLGTGPDTGTGDSARRGGEKVNNLFADIYANLGDNPIGNDPNGPFYGYVRTFEEFEYKVGEIHAAGKFHVVNFDSDNAIEDRAVTFNSDTGYSNTQDTNLTGVPDIYRNLNWYFLSRGERITLDLSKIADNASVNLILPLASTGDMVVIKDTLNNWDNKIINVWTTPYDFISSAQVDEWIKHTPEVEIAPDSEAISIRFSTDSEDNKVYANYKVSSDDGNILTFSNTPLVLDNSADREVRFIYKGPTNGWLAYHAQDARLVAEPVNQSDPGSKGDYAVGDDCVYFHNGTEWNKVTWSTWS